MHNMKALTVFFLMILPLSGCGGGGGDSTTPTPPPNIAPVANAGTDQALTLSFLDTRTITLTGTSSDSDGTVVAHQWDQTGGTTVTLSGAATSTATFTVDATTEAYSFSYTATDDDGAQHSDTVLVYVTEIIFSDSFADGLNWDLDDNTVIGEDWAVDNGTLLQENTVIDFQESYHTGTYAVLDATAVSGLSSYRFSVDITPLTNTVGNGQGNDVGVMFGYQNNNYYRVSMNARYGFTRFEKRTTSGFETLAVNAMGYVDNQPMTITAEINGNTIIVWIDGEPVFAEVDSSILAGTIALYCQDRAQFDNVKITENPLQPMVAISSPLAYSVLPGDLVDLTVTAVVLNKPAGGSVAFSLDGGSEIPVAGSGSVYLRVFTSVFNGNHDVAAIVRYTDGTEAGSDTNSMVGTGGDYYVTVGDSITNGVGDFNPANNDSADGRIVAIQGYQARLADLLTVDTSRPQIVFNEGIPGDKASDLEARINSILERHPGANKVLMMIGTNDSSLGNRPSAIDFQDSIETITTLINVDDKRAWLAKTLPAYQTLGPPAVLDTDRNVWITDYNAIIESIATANDFDDIFTGPDFYTAFNDPDLYADILHPNDAGYQVMANRWRIPLP